MKPLAIITVIALMALAMGSTYAQQGLGLDSASLRAQLVPTRQATLSAEMAGKLTSMKVREGQAVKAGALLAAFDCSVPKAQLDKAQIEVSMAKNTLIGNKRLAQMNAIGSVELENSQLLVSKAESEVNYLRAVLSRCSIHAPYSGHISQVYVNDNEFIQSGSKLFDIQEGSDLQLEFIVPSAWLKWLTKGKTFDVKIEDTGKQYPAEVSYSNVKVDPMSQSVKVVGKIKGNHPELLAGMSGIVQFDPAAQANTK